MVIYTQKLRVNNLYTALMHYCVKTVHACACTEGFII